MCDKDYVFILDAGHGGIIDGEYQTSGKRSPKWKDGTQLFEGVFNREVVKRTIKLCDFGGIRTIDLIPTQEDVPLRVRTNKANELYRELIQENKKSLYISVHANAAGVESAHGWEVFTTVGETKSDKLATVFYDEMKKQFPERRFRKDNSDGDVDKESNFWVLRKVIMPAVLTENFFMTNEDECKNILMNDDAIDRIAYAHYKAIKYISDNSLL